MIWFTNSVILFILCLIGFGFCLSEPEDPIHPDDLKFLSKYQNDLKYVKCNESVKDDISREMLCLYYGYPKNQSEGDCCIDSDILCYLRVAVIIIIY